MFKRASATRVRRIFVQAVNSTGPRPCVQTFKHRCKISDNPAELSSTLKLLQNGGVHLVASTTPFGATLFCARSLTLLTT